MWYNKAMPSRNVIKFYDTDSYYHIYNRGVNRRRIFIDEHDYKYFLMLLQRYLGKNTNVDDRKRRYPNYSGEVDLIAFCLMPNHFHLMIAQNDSIKAMESFMRSLVTSYTKYFNKRHRRIGHLFQGPYKASKITNEPYLLHISRYIHLNPKEYKSWPYSSWPYYTRGWMVDWVKQHKVFELFEGGDYEKFVEDYKPEKEVLDALYKLIANSK